MIQIANVWKFYQDRNGQWQWRKFMNKKIVAVSYDSFPSRNKCICNAEQRGYVAIPKKERSLPFPI